MQHNHSNKHIRDAIRYAENKGWRVAKAGPRAHIWGTLWCPQRTREGVVFGSCQHHETLKGMPVTFIVTLTVAFIHSEENIVR